MEGDPVDAAIAFAEVMIANAPLSIAGAKRVLQSIATGTLERDKAEIQEMIDRAFDSEDYKEKRRPNFRGR